MLLTIRNRVLRRSKCFSGPGVPDCRAFGGRWGRGAEDLILPYKEVSEILKFFRLQFVRKFGNPDFLTYICLHDEPSVPYDDRLGMPGAWRSLRLRIVRDHALHNRDDYHPCGGQVVLIP